MKFNLPVFEFIIDDSEESGVKTISLVTDPAMKSSFIAFDKQEPKQKYVFLEKDEKEYKGIVAGLAMIPNKMVYRADEDGTEYMGYFSEKTILKIRDKYHKQVQNLTSVNLEHTDYFVNAYLVESYILDTENRVEEVKNKGIEEAVLGSWYTAFKVEDKKVFEACLEGTFTGFSVEAFLERELKMSTNNNNNKKIVKMKKNLIERLKERVNKILDEVNFESALVPELNVEITWDSEGMEVTKTYVSDDDLEVTEAIGEGEFVLEDGRTIVVDVGSMLVEVRDAAPVEEELVDPEEEVPVVSGDTEVVIDPEVVVDPEVVPEIEVVVDPEEEVPVVSGDTEVIIDAAAEVSAKTLGELVDVSTNGTYNIAVEVVDGVITEATVSAEQSLITQQLNDKIKELEVKLSEPIAEPKLKDKDIEGDVKELTVYEAIAKRKGIQTV